MLGGPRECARCVEHAAAPPAPCDACSFELQSVSQLNFTVPPRAHPSTGSQSGFELGAAVTVYASQPGLSGSTLHGCPLRESRTPGHCRYSGPKNKNSIFPLKGERGSRLTLSTVHSRTPSHGLLSPPGRARLRRLAQVPFLEPILLGPLHQAGHLLGVTK